MEKESWETIGNMSEKAGNNNRSRKVGQLITIWPSELERVKSIRNWFQESEKWTAGLHVLFQSHSFHVFLRDESVFCDQAPP